MSAGHASARNRRQADLLRDATNRRVDLGKGFSIPRLEMDALPAALSETDVRHSPTGTMVSTLDPIRIWTATSSLTAGASI